MNEPKIRSSGRTRQPTAAPAAMPARRPAELRDQPRISRLPQHLGVIPDGNRRWAAARGLPRGAGYAAGVGVGLRLLRVCRELGIPEVSVYGFTKENVRRPRQQVEAFRAACVEVVERAAAEGLAVLVVGDSASSSFPAQLRPFAKRRSPGDLRFNLLVNYGWQWDLFTALRRSARDGVTYMGSPQALASAALPRIDLVLRWGGRRRLSGFLPLQCAYADFHVFDTLWPDAVADELLAAVDWYRQQDVSLGG